MTRTTTAWLLDCGGGTLAATGNGSVLHVVEDAALLFKVPLAPPHCNRVLVWRDLLLPAVDLARYITGRATSIDRPLSCVLGWRNATGASEYGVIVCQSLPRRIDISDDQRTEPNEGDAKRWSGIALAFFNHSGRATPIIHPGAPFGSMMAKDASERTEHQRIA